jgi:Domain of unknown function (DUF5071)
MNTYPYGSKSDWQRQADQIAAGVILTSAKDIPMLLDWLKDMNWPGAETIANYLPSFGEDVRPALVPVLESGDAIWTRWVLAALSESFDERFWQPLTPAIQRVAYGKDIEGAAAEALYILARYRLESVSNIQAALEEAKRLPGFDPDDYVRFEALL